jgi:hypothetical protein
MRTILLGAALVAMASVSHAAVLCTHKKADGTYNSTVKAREACKPSETQVDAGSFGLASSLACSRTRITPPCDTALTPDAVCAATGRTCVATFLSLLFVGVEDVDDCNLPIRACSLGGNYVEDVECCSMNP